MPYSTYVPSEDLERPQRTALQRALEAMSPPGLVQQAGMLRERFDALGPVRVAERTADDLTGLFGRLGPISPLEALSPARLGARAGAAAGRAVAESEAGVEAELRAGETLREFGESESGQYLQAPLAPARSTFGAMGEAYQRGRETAPGLLGAGLGALGALPAGYGQLAAQAAQNIGLPDPRWRPTGAPGAHRLPRLRGADRAGREPAGAGGHRGAGRRSAPRKGPWRRQGARRSDWAGPWRVGSTGPSSGNRWAPWATSSAGASTAWAAASGGPRGRSTARRRGSSRRAWPGVSPGVCASPTTPCSVRPSRIRPVRPSAATACAWTWSGSRSLGRPAGRPTACSTWPGMRRSTPTRPRFGGSERIAGPTLFQRPYVVYGETGGQAIGRAADALLGARAATDMRYPAQRIAQTLRYDGTDAERVAGWLSEHGGDPASAEAIVRGALSDANHADHASRLMNGMMENAIAAELRRQGFDGMVGVGGRGRFHLTEVMDVRERQFPGPAGEFGLRPELQAALGPGDDVLGIRRGQRLRQPPLTPEQQVQRAADGAAEQRVFDAIRALWRRGPAGEEIADELRFLSVGKGEAGEAAARELLASRGLEDVLPPPTAAGVVARDDRGRRRRARTGPAGHGAPHGPAPPATPGERAFDVAAGTAGGVVGAATAEEDATWQERVGRGALGASLGALGGANLRQLGRVGRGALGGRGVGRASARDGAAPESDLARAAREAREHASGLPRSRPAPPWRRQRA